MTHGRPDELARALERLAARMGHLLGDGPFAYGLIDRQPVPLSPIGWLAWIRQHPPGEDDAWRRVGLDVVPTPAGDVEVSTVFLLTAGMTSPDALFETMVSFAGGRQSFERYASWDAAARGHADAVAALHLYGELAPDATRD